MYKVTVYSVFSKIDFLVKLKKQQTKRSLNAENNYNYNEFSLEL